MKKLCSTVEQNKVKTIAYIKYCVVIGLKYWQHIDYHLKYRWSVPSGSLHMPHPRACSITIEMVFRNSAASVYIFLAYQNIKEVSGEIIIYIYLGVLICCYQCEFVRNTLSTSSIVIQYCHCVFPAV